MRGSVVIDSPASSPPSFWECKEYQRTVKRVESANKICSNLVVLVHERALLEKQHAANLRKWSQNVMSFLDSGMEYGTGAFLWKSLCAEAEAVSNAHETVCSILLNEIRACIKHWQKEHFQKSSMPPQTLKQSKQLEQDFEQAQKPWAKRLKKVVQARKDYHHACQTERSLQVQLQNAKTDPSGAPEQLEADSKLKKIQEKLAKAVRDMERTRTVYTSALSDLDQDNPRYLEEMTRVFNTAQDLERERLTFASTVFDDLHQALNITTKADFNVIYDEMKETIGKCNIEEDLSWWSSHHGVDMPVDFPQFEEYSPELSSIAPRKRSPTMDSGGGVTVTAIAPVISAPFQPKGDPTEDIKNSATAANGHKYSHPTPFDDVPATTEAVDAPSGEAVVSDAPVGDESADAADYYLSATYDDGRPGVLVRALYDYKSEEDDELNFITGEVFEKLEEADDQGWCKGRKDGRAGLYPANYVEAI